MNRAAATSGICLPVATGRPKRWMCLFWKKCSWTQQKLIMDGYIYLFHYIYIYICTFTIYPFSSGFIWRRIWFKNRGSQRASETFKPFLVMNQSVVIMVGREKVESSIPFLVVTCPRSSMLFKGCGCVCKYTVYIYIYTSHIYIYTYTMIHIYLHTHMGNLCESWFPHLA